MPATVCAVGIRSARRLLAAAAELERTTSSSAQRGLVSPWQGDTLSTIVLSDLFGTEPVVVTRAEAITVPAVVKARQVLVGELAGLPLVAMRGADVLPADEQPSFLYRTDGLLSPWHRMAWTIDDLLFTGWSLWSVTRGAGGVILAADRVPRDEWAFDGDGRVTIQGQVVTDARSVILFPGAIEGLCVYAARTIRAYRDTERAWQGRVRSPIPVVELHQTSDDVLTDDEIDAIVDDYVKARRDVNGAVVYTPSQIEIRTHGEADPSMLVEARNALRVDVANLTGLPAAALDGSVAASSLTYITQEGKFSELGEAIRGLYLEPIEARLSQDDVVPRGQRVRFDVGDRLAVAPSPTGPEVQD